MADHARVVIGGELVEEMLHIARIGARGGAHRLGLGDLVGQHVGGLVIVELGEFGQRIVRLAGFEPGAAEQEIAP